MLQLPPSARGDAEAARAAYRRLSVRWHPDKNAGQEARAQAVFVRVAAAYNTLTTVNFDYTRCGHATPAPRPSTPSSHGLRRCHYRTRAAGEPPACGA